MTLSFVTKIDDMFAPSLPAEVLDNAANLNKSRTLKITVDQNSWSLIYKRIRVIVKEKMSKQNKEINAKRK